MCCFNCECCISCRNRSSLSFYLPFLLRIFMTLAHLMRFHLVGHRILGSVQHVVQRNCASSHTYIQPVTRPFTSQHLGLRWYETVWCGRIRVEKCGISALPYMYWILWECLQIRVRCTEDSCTNLRQCCVRWRILHLISAVSTGLYLFLDAKLWHDWPLASCTTVPWGKPMALDVAWIFRKHVLVRLKLKDYGFSFSCILQVTRDLGICLGWGCWGSINHFSAMNLY